MQIDLQQNQHIFQQKLQPFTTKKSLNNKILYNLSCNKNQHPFQQK